MQPRLSIFHPRCVAVPSVNKVVRVWDMRRVGGDDRIDDRKMEGGGSLLAVAAPGSPGSQGGPRGKGG